MDGNDDAAEIPSTEMPVPKIKHDWYQTDTYVVVTILVKNAENVAVIYTETTLSVSAKLPSGNEYSLELDLAHPIVVEQSLHKRLPSKIEIKLKKRDGTRWLVLEGNCIENEEVKPIPNEILQASKQASNYPSSCKRFKDWDKVGKEIEKAEAAEEAEGDSAINSLFQSIYGKGSDEVRRAMNKSFLESGGTVLSTNWEEVGRGTVERKPPDGMEWKSWNV